MGKNKKILKIVVVITTLIAFSCVILFFASHKTCNKYNDWWIKGKTIEEVEARYGKAYQFSQGGYGYFIEVDWVNCTDAYYIMITDDEGKIIKVYRGSPRGKPIKRS